MRTLPKVLKYLPSDKAQDARNFVQSLQYWLGGNADNLENLLINTAQSYVPALKGANMETADPQLFPETGIWHPMAPSFYEDLKEYLNWWVCFCIWGKVCCFQRCIDWVSLQVVQGQP